jgi:N-terminal half of MaoC dehydratase
VHVEQWGTHGDRTFPVEPGHVLAFAQAIGDENPVYRDADPVHAVGLDGIAAPPTFVQASAHFDPDYPLRPNPGVEWFDSGAGPGALDERGAGVCTASSTTSTTPCSSSARC